MTCCDLHGRNCEPASELCYEGCTEAAHLMGDAARGFHADGSKCSNPDLSYTNLDDADQRAKLVARLRAIIEWVDARDSGRAVDLDLVVHELETLARESSRTACSCKGYGWVDDENWSPETHEVTRAPGAGRVPCGFCNHGGWDRPDSAGRESRSSRAGSAG